MNKHSNIDLPSGSKRPLKANIFQEGQSINAQLTPLFSYFEAGSIVPCCAVMRSDGVDYGRFHHTNSVDEVAIVFGSNAQVFRTGEVHVGAREHGVQGPPKEYPQAYVLFCVTQRQIDEEQSETMSFCCENCGEELFRHEFGEDQPDVFPVLPTIRGSYDIASRYEGAVCKHCGHDNPPFPEERWGWSAQVRNTQIVSQAYLDCKEAVNQ